MYVKFLGVNNNLHLTTESFYVGLKNLPILKIVALEIRRLNTKSHITLSFLLGITLPVLWIFLKHEANLLEDEASVKITLITKIWNKTNRKTRLPNLNNRKWQQESLILRDYRWTLNTKSWTLSRWNWFSFVSSFTYSTKYGLTVKHTTNIFIEMVKR